MVMAPLSTFWPKNGSHRRPALTVTRLVSAPRVLRVDALIPLVVIDAATPRLIERRDAAEQQVREPQIRSPGR